MIPLRVAAAQPADLSRYLDLLEETAEWLTARGITQWRPGSFRQSADYYAHSIASGEVHVAFAGDELAGTLRLLLSEPLVWPDVTEDDGLYVFNLAVRRTWADHGFGRQLLDWAAERAGALGRRWLRLDCVTGNDFLRDYYSRAGFEDRGDIEARFPAPVGTLWLRRYEKRV